MFSQGLSSLKNAASTDTRLTWLRTSSASRTTAHPKPRAVSVAGGQPVARDAPAEDARGSGVGRQQRAEDADQRRLAAPVGPQHASHAARLDVEVEVVKEIGRASCRERV